MPARARGRGRNREAIEKAKREIAQANREVTRLTREEEEINKENEKAKTDIVYLQHLHDELLRQRSICEQEIADMETLLRSKERHIDEVKEVAAAEIRVFQKKVKHLMAANQSEYANANSKGEERIFQQRLEQLHSATDAQNTVSTLRSDENDLLLQNETLLTAIRTQNDRRISEMRDEFERMSDALRAEHEQQSTIMRNQMEEQRQRETAELERRKNQQIKNLQEKHAASFDHIRRFFSGVTHNNLEVIKQDKQKIAEKKAKINGIRKEVDEITAQKRKLEIPIHDLTTENEKLRKEIEVYDRDKRDLARNKAKIKKLEEQLTDLQLSQEVLEQRFEQVQEERDSLYDQFESSIHEVRQKTEFRAYVLEQKVKKLRSELEAKEMELQRVMEEQGFDSTAISAKLDDVMAVKNARINQLEVEVARVVKAHNDILTAFQAKMEKYGIPQEEFGFAPLEPIVEYSCA